MRSSSDSTKVSELLRANMMWEDYAGWELSKCPGSTAKVGEPRSEGVEKLELA